MNEARRRTRSNGSPSREWLSFFFAWLANPRRVGALFPSSASLAAAMTADLTPASAPIIELGPGTGAVTRSIIARGIPESRLALIEYRRDFARSLRREFPCARVHELDATRLQHIDLFAGERAGAVVSGIPLRLMSPSSVLALLHGAFERLRPGGAFYQFTYGREVPVARAILDGHGLEVTRMGATLTNLPPAVVYRIRRRSEHPLQYCTARAPIPGRTRDVAPS